MKKRKLIERRRALKEAYYNELRKMNVLDPVKTYKDMTKAELIEEGKALGIELDMKLTKNEMIASIECHNEPVEQAEEDNKTIEDVVNEIVEEGKDPEVQDVVKDNEEQTEEEKEEDKEPVVTE